MNHVTIDVLGWHPMSREKCDELGSVRGVRAMQGREWSAERGSKQQIALATHHCALVLTQKRWDHRQVCCDTTESNHTQPRCNGIGQSEVGSL